METEIIEYDNRIEYLLDGLRHRDNGPARIYKDGSEEWWQNGKYHRDNGPAIIWRDDEKEYYLNDIEYSLDDYKLILFTFYKKYYHER